MVRSGALASEWLVRGTSSYRVRLSMDAQGLGASCTCPYGADEGVCKHMVAAALVWRTCRDVDDPKRAPGQTLLSFLQQRPPIELAQRLLAWAQRDGLLAAELETWRAAHEPLDLAGWKRALDAALRSRYDDLDADEAAAYARRAANILPLLQALCEQDPCTARQASVKAVRRLLDVYGMADDDDGALEELIHQTVEVLMVSLAASPPDAAQAPQWMKTWRELQANDHWDFCREGQMLALAGPAVGAVASASVARAWAGWLARRTEQGMVRDVRTDHERSRLRAMYLEDRRRHGDAAAVLEALQDDVRSAGEAVELARALEAAHRPREALRVLEQAARIYPDDARVEDALLMAYRRDGCHEDVFRILRGRLERWPTVEGYIAVLDAAQAAGQDRAACRAELYRWAQARERGHGERARFGRAPSAGADVSLRLAWLLHDGHLSEAHALASCEGHVASIGVLHDLARGLGKQRHEGADALFARLMNICMARASSPYREALALAAEWLSILPPQQARQRLAWLKATWRAKRNFIAGLEALAGP